MVCQGLKIAGNCAGSGCKIKAPLPVIEFGRANVLRSHKRNKRKGEGKPEVFSRK
jgi:hypothetical protein